jgi:CO/xanthine dehydrogenase FAD-binding subunit
VRSFAYQAPATLTEAVSLLSMSGESARALAGGTDLLVQMRCDLLTPDLLVDVKKIPDLGMLSYSPEAGLTVGAAVPLYRVCAHPALAAHYPGLLDAASLIGGAAIQGRATLGGNLCNAAPSGDAIPALMALAAECVIAGPQGSRTVPVAEFCTAPRRTVLGRGELLVSIHLAPPRANSGAHYLRFTVREEMDIAVAGAAAWLELSADLAMVQNARIALGAVGPTPLLAEAAAGSLVGRAPTEEALAEAASLAAKVARPITDVRGTAAQRRHLAGVLARRALCGALQRAQGGEADGCQG